MKKNGVCYALLLIWIVLPGCQSPHPSTDERPLIGITTAYNPEHRSLSVPAAYVDAVSDCGGIPLVLPALDDLEAIRRYVAELDGLVLIGGRDIPPALYDQLPHETAVPIPERRVTFDQALIAQWMASKKPILGVCLGMQFTNVVTGGSMIQDIPSLVGTDVTHAPRAYHTVTLAPDSVLARILGANTAEVLSWHHQAVDRLGAGLKPVAWAADGMIEALERTDGGAGLFVQWHPEMMAEDNPEHMHAVYGYLVQLTVDN